MLVMGAPGEGKMAVDSMARGGAEMGMKAAEKQA